MEETRVDLFALVNTAIYTHMYTAVALSTYSVHVIAEECSAVDVVKRPFRTSADCTVCRVTCPLKAASEYSVETAAAVAVVWFVFILGLWSAARPRSGFRCSPNF